MSETSAHNVRKPTARELRRLLSVHDWNVAEVARALEVSPYRVWYWLRRYGIRLPRSWEILTLDVLRELYLERDLSVSEIARRVRYSSSTIRLALRRHGIRKRARQSKRPACRRCGILPEPGETFRDGLCHWCWEELCKK